MSQQFTAIVTRAAAVMASAAAWRTEWRVAHGHPALDQGELSPSEGRFELAVAVMTDVLNGPVTRSALAWAAPHITRFDAARAASLIQGSPFSRVHTAAARMNAVVARLDEASPADITAAWADAQNVWDYAISTARQALDWSADDCNAEYSAVGRNRTTDTAWWNKASDAQSRFIFPWTEAERDAAQNRILDKFEARDNETRGAWANILS